MRKIYVDLIRTNAASLRGLHWVGRCALRYAQVQLSRCARRPLCGPILGTLLTNYTCNLSCAMCDLPEKGRRLRLAGGQDLSTERMKSLIDAFAGLGTLGIGFTGGEPLLRGDLLDLLTHTRERGMIAHLNTNGTLVTDGLARAIVATGLASLNVSVDGATAATHDKTRGMPGAFERATAGLRSLQRARRDAGAPLRLKVVSVLSERNAPEVSGIVRLSRELGADATEFIPEQPLRGREARRPTPLLTPEVGEAIRILRELKRSGHPIENSDRMLDLFPLSFRGAPSPVSCSAGFNSLTADCYGNLYLCLPRLAWQRPSARITETTLAAAWQGRSFQEERRSAASCRACFLNCHAELNLLFDPVALSRRQRPVDPQGR